MSKSASYVEMPRINDLHKHKLEYQGGRKGSKSQKFRAYCNTYVAMARTLDRTEEVYVYRRIR